MTREIILAQRAGYVAGAQAAAGARWSPKRQLKAIAESEAAFPLTEERPRVVRTLLPPLPIYVQRRFGVSERHIEYRIANGRLESRVPSVRPDAPERFKVEASRWRPSHLTPAVLQQLTELFARPTETVEIS